MEEADAAHSKADFIAKCRIALKESRETRYWLTLFGDSEELPREQIESLIHESNELVAILTSIVKNSTTARPKSF
jgi:four helix bundle protein